MKVVSGLGALGNKARRLAPLIGALVLGLLAAVLGWYYLRSSEREIAASLEQEARAQRRDVVVPVRDLRAGQALTPDLVAKRSVPSDYVHQDALTPASFGEYAGRQLTVDVAAGKPFLSSFFASPRKVFSEELEAGVRAVTIPVDEISSISGMLRAGDRIDFMYVANNASASDTSQQLVVPLLQDVEVRATGQLTSEQFAAMRKSPDVAPGGKDPYGRQQYTTVTVALKPENAQKLVLAQRMGKIVAALRNPGDRQQMRTGIDGRELEAIVNSFRNAPTALPVSAASIEYIVGGTGSRSTRLPVGLPPALAAAAQAAAAPASSD